MARLTIGGRDFEIAPYKLGDLEIAAPFIDQINGSGADLGSIEGLVAKTKDMLAVLSVGLVKIDPTLTPEALKGMVDIGDLPALGNAFTDILYESGMRPGEAKAPASGRAKAGASKSRSKKSSMS